MTGFWLALILWIVISIHTALAGCDQGFPYTEQTYHIISIHTALAGCDELNIVTL